MSITSPAQASKSADTSEQQRRLASLAPEILAGVGSHLPLPALSSLGRTNRATYSVLSPFISHSTTLEGIPSHLRSLDIALDARSAPTLVSTLNQHRLPSLERLTLLLRGPDVDDTRELLTALRRLAGLRDLSLTVQSTPDMRGWPQAWQWRTSTAPETQPLLQPEDEYPGLASLVRLALAAPYGYDEAGLLPHYDATNDFFATPLFRSFVRSILRDAARTLRTLVLTDYSPTVEYCHFFDPDHLSPNSLPALRTLDACNNHKQGFIHVLTLSPAVYLAAPALETLALEPYDELDTPPLPAEALQHLIHFVGGAPAAARIIVHDGDRRALRTLVVRCKGKMPELEQVLLAAAATDAGSLGPPMLRALRLVEWPKMKVDKAEKVFRLLGTRLGQQLESLLIDEGAPDGLMTTKHPIKPAFFSGFPKLKALGIVLRATVPPPRTAQEAARWSAACPSLEVLAWARTDSHDFKRTLPPAEECVWQLRDGEGGEETEPQLLDADVSRRVWRERFVPERANSSKARELERREKYRVL